MENKINIAELLKDCPSGMELYSPLFGVLKFVEVRNYETQIIVKLETGATVSFHTDGRYYDYPNAECILFPSKDKPTWEGFQRPFMDGDIVVCTNENCTFTAIFKGMRNDSSFYRYGVMYDNKFRCLVNDWSDFNDSCRLATEEEKEKLFKAIKDNGYVWNAENKTLKKLAEPKFKKGDIIQDKDGYKVRITNVSIEDECYGYESLTVNGIGCISFNRQDKWELVPNKFDITTLVPFESRVLVRHNKDNKWCGSFFSHIDKDLHSNCYKFVTIAGKSYPMMIPYEENQHLLGTTNDCDEFYKNW